MKLWEVRTGKCQRTLKEHRAAVYAVAISRDGKTLATGSEDSPVKLWDVTEGK